MNLSKKKSLAAKVLRIGEGRVVFLKSRLNEIRDAITKQDIRDLNEDGAILIREIKGRRKSVKSSKRRGPGKIRKKTNTRKRTYMILTRKLRRHVFGLKTQGKVSNEDYSDLRKKIRNRFFKSKAHLKEYSGGITR